MDRQRLMKIRILEKSEREIQKTKNTESTKPIGLLDVQNLTDFRKKGGKEKKIQEKKKR